MAVCNPVQINENYTSTKIMSYIVIVDLKM